MAASAWPVLCAAQQDDATTQALIDRYGGPVLSCYEAAQTAPAKEACAGRLASACSAQEEGGQTTFGIMTCQLAEAAFWDARMAHEYAGTLAWLGTVDQAEAEYFPEFAHSADALPAMQEAWRAYRDANCALQYALWGSGSMRMIAGADCHRAMTAAQAIALWSLREEM